jgi:photosystem II stability/assembly factor-like uncharacterized protein
MNRKLFILLALGFISAINSQLSPVFAQGTAFSYDGRLQDSGGPANGTYNFTFSLYTDSSGGSPVAGPVTTNGVAVSNGLFTVQMDFGAGVWNGQINWLEIAVETNTGNSFSTLSPRQQITPTPYAIFATTSGNLSGTLPLAQLPAAVVTNGASGLNLTGSFIGDGGGLTNVPAYWQTVSGTSQTASANYAYLLTNNSLSTVTLPASPNVGDIVTVSGVGTAGWLVAANAGQTIPGSAVVPAGVIWTPQNSGIQAWRAIASSADGTKLVAGGLSTPIYTSDDSGVTWTAQNSSPSGCASVASSADGTKLVAIPQNGPIYTSGDSGVTWTAQNSPPDEEWVSVASSSDGTKLVAASGYGGFLYISGDSGVTWGEPDPEVDGLLFSVASSANGNNLVVVGEDQPIFTTTDAGVTWSGQNNAPGSLTWRAVTSSADGTKLAAAAFNSPIYTSADSGVTWTAQNSGNQYWASLASSSDGTKLVAAAGAQYEESQIYTSGDSGVTWTAQNGAPTAFWWAVTSSSDGTKLAATGYGPSDSGGQIYTSDATEAFSGAPNTTVQFQYVGNGVWQPLGQLANLLTGGLTTNLVVTVPTGTKTLSFTNGVLRAVQ